MTTFVFTQAARMRDVVVGAVYQAGDAGELVVQSVRYTASRPFTGSTADTVQRRLGEMAARGATER